LGLLERNCREIQVHKLTEALTDFSTISTNSREKELEEEKKRAEEKLAREAKQHEDDAEQLDMERTMRHSERQRILERVHQMRERIATLNPAEMEDEPDLPLNLSTLETDLKEIT